LNLDLILYGLPEQLAPERELLAREMMLTLGSSSAIVAHNLAALGSRVGFVSRIGDDQMGRIALDRLSAAGVDVSKVQKIATPAKTGLTVILQRDKWRNILTYPGTIFDLRPQDLDLEYLASAKHFHLSSFYLHRGLRAYIPELFRQLKSRGMTISLDPNDDPDDRWDGLDEVFPYVDVLLPNGREAKRMAGTDDLQEAIAQLASKVPLLVVKLGAEGATASRGAEQLKSPALSVTVVDPVGAGDSFDAGFLHEFVRGSDLASCLASGNRAGAFSTTAPGGTEAFRNAQLLEQFVRAQAGVPQPNG
jgi:sugar/nucleoside kinase (ribokinase family)